MTARFFLQCLSIPRLTTIGGHELKLRVRKHMALLVYLAVEDRVRHRRDHLIDLLWPGVSNTAGRQSLATALSNIRGRLGAAALETDRDSARLASGVVRLDLERLEAGEVTGDDVIPPLEVSGFLEGFELPGVPEYHLWRDRQQARLLPAIQRGLIALADMARRSGDLPRLGRHADRLLVIDELSEDGIRARMEASALAGDRITALRVFEAWAGRLERDLGAKPSPRIENMAMRLRRRGWERPMDPPIPAVATEHWASREFVGRAREYRRLYEAWDRVQTGAASHLLLTGVSGVGKTTLADRFTTALSLEGAQVARVRAYELERGIPYAAIGSAIEIFLDRPGTGATDPVSLAELARVVPEVRRRYHQLPEIPEAEGESARIRFATATLDLVRALAGEHPVVVMFDDFDQADDASLAVLNLLMRRGRELPFMVVLTARTEWPHEAPTAKRIRDSGPHLGIQEIVLGPMPLEESQVLLEALLRRAGLRATAAERKALLRAAAGFPLALELLLKHWEEHRHDATLVNLDAMTADVSQAPEDVYRRLAEGILTGLDATALMVLHLAAVLDRRMNELEMYGTVDLTPAGTMGNLSLLAARGVLRDSGGGLEFLNPMIRAHAYYSIPAGMRKVLHGGVAARLLEREAAGAEIPGLEIAWHCVRGGRETEARPYLLRGAREAMREGAPYQTELAIRSGMSLLSHGERDEATFVLAEALQEQARWAESIEALSGLQETAPDFRRAEIHFLASLARLRLGLVNRTASMDVITDALSVLKEPFDVPAKVQALSVGATYCERLRDREISGELFRAAQPLLSVMMQDHERASVLFSLAMLSAHQGQITPALVCLEEAHSLSHASRLKNGLACWIHTGLGAAKIAQGDYQGALAYSNEAFELAQHLENHNWAAIAANNMALCHGRLGDHQLQLRAARVALESHPDLSETGVLLAGWAYAGFAAGMLGDRSAVDQAVDHLTGIATQTDLPWVRQRAWLACADAMWLVGQTTAAVAFARKATVDSLTVASLAGDFARWKVVLALKLESEDRDLVGIEELVREANELDTLDRAQLLFAVRMHRKLSLEETKLLEESLLRLPQSISDQLCRLGLRA